MRRRRHGPQPIPVDLVAVSEVERILTSSYGRAWHAARAVVGDDDAWDCVHDAFYGIFRRRRFLLRLTSAYVVKAARTTALALVRQREVRKTDPTDMAAFDTSVSRSRPGRVRRDVSRSDYVSMNGDPESWCLAWRVVEMREEAERQRPTRVSSYPRYS
jgi:DNA-directed RNA polymerase specialized sigma24 family protein